MKDHNNRLEENLEVGADRPILDIIEIEVEHLAAADVASSRHLPRAREARQDRETAGVPIGFQGFQPLAITKLQRTRADQAHLSDQDVPELGKFVEAGPTQESTQGRDSGIILDLEQDAAGGLVLRFERDESSLGVGNHGPEFQTPECPTTETYPLLAKEDRTPRIETNQESNDQHDRDEKDQPKKGTSQIHTPLHDRSSGR